jgi:hypothetical protein
MYSVYRFIFICHLFLHVEGKVTQGFIPCSVTNVVSSVDIMTFIVLANPGSQTIPGELCRRQAANRCQRFELNLATRSFLRKAPTIASELYMRELQIYVRSCRPSCMHHALYARGFNGRAYTYQPTGGYVPIVFLRHINTQLTTKYCEFSEDR